MQIVIDIPDHIYELAKEDKLKYWTQGITDKIVFNGLKNATSLEEVLEDIKEEIKQWYWDTDKQALAKDPCVVDAMIDLFIRTIDKYTAESEVQDANSD